MRYLLIVALCVLGLSSCVEERVETKAGFTMGVDKFKYNKHDYLLFEGNGVEHDPECKYCLEKYE